ncbi:hypothetical protein BDW72DRAFT_177270 [Aspergillus terricola var. indicus]
MELGTEGNSNECNHCRKLNLPFCQVRFTLIVTIILWMLLVPCYLTVHACALTRGRDWNKHPGSSSLRIRSLAGTMMEH